MPVILIQNAIGETEIRELSKQFPIAIGRHSSNDLQIQAVGVEVLHCRISWNSRAFEVVSGTHTGVNVNGEFVASSLLTLGDCILVGDTSIFFYPRRDQAEAALRGETVEEETPAEEQPSEATRQAVPVDPPDRPVRRRGSTNREPVSQTHETEPPAPLIRSPRTPPVDSVVTKDSARRSPLETVSTTWTDEEASDEPEVVSQASIPRLQQRLGTGGAFFDLKAKRPGEQELLRSPLIVSLSIFTSILVLVAIALWFLIGRDASAKAYQLAVSEMEQKRFGPAITQFQEFLKQYPSHQFASAARHAIGQSLVEQPLSGAAPSFDKALLALDEYITKERRAKDFPEMIPKVLELAHRIAKGAADAAGTQKKAELLKVSENASRLLQQYSPPDKPPTQALADIDSSTQKARTAIRKHSTYQVALTEMDRELKKNRPFAAFEVRRKLLLQYSELASDKNLQERVASALKTERALASRRIIDQAAETSELAPNPSLPELNLLRQTRTRADTVASGTNVFTLTDTTCFAVDSVTGNPRWKRFLGTNPPFPPYPIALDVLSVLVFDTQSNELLLLKQRDGTLTWRQKLPSPASAGPLLHEGQIFIPTQSGVLCQLDVVTGKFTSQLSFSQPLASSPIVIANGERLLAAGDRAVLYTLNYRPLECIAVTYTGHSSGSIQAPPLRMGEFVLTTENDRQDSAKLRVWDASKPEASLVELVTSRVQGNVKDPAVLRGKQLVVPSAPERLAAFTVSDERGEKALSASATYQVEKPEGGPIFVTLGPDDELWMTSSSLRRLRIGADTLIPETGQLTLGISSLPVQLLDQSLFATSRIKSSTGTFFLSADRHQMVSHWLIALGGRALGSGTTAAADGSVPLFVDTGDVFSVTATKLNAGGFDNRPVTSLVLPPGLTKPPHVTVLSNGRLAVWCDGQQPRIWLFNTDGIVAKELPLPGELEAPPILLSGGIVLPLKGKLRLIEAPGFAKPVEDLMPPVDPQHPTAWKAVLALDEKQLIAINDQGRVLRAQVRTEPVPHLAEVASIELKLPVDFAPILSNNRIYLVAEKILYCLDASTLERRAEVVLPASVSQGVWSLGQQLLLICGKQQILGLDSEPPCQINWQQKHEHGALAGTPLVRGDRWIEATYSGIIQIRNPTDGSITRALEVKRPLVLGPVVIQDQVVVATLDGSLLVLNSWLEKAP